MCFSAALQATRADTKHQTPSIIPIPLSIVLPGRDEKQHAIEVVSATCCADQRTIFAYKLNQGATKYGSIADYDVVRKGLLGHAV